MRNSRIILFVVLLFVGIASCKKESDKNEKNPYDDWTYEYPIDTDTLKIPSPTSVAGLYHNIFKPTCANSGCHDGNFEPDFRSLESTYKSLVNKKVTKADSLGMYDYRVVPGNADMSMLIIRMIEDLNGNSGIMPLSVDPNSDWHTKKEEYIQNVKDWINAGAKDIFDNSPQSVDMKPILKGFVVTPKGSVTPYGRTGNAFSAYRVPPSATEIDVWFAFDDDNTLPQNFTFNKVKYGIHLPTLDDLDEASLQIVPDGPDMLGLNAEDVKYTHKITLNKNDIGVSGDVIWFRAYVQDAVNPIHSYPSPNSIFRIKTYCSLLLE